MDSLTKGHKTMLHHYKTTSFISREYYYRFVHSTMATANPDTSEVPNGGEKEGDTGAGSGGEGEGGEADRAFEVT